MRTRGDGRAGDDAHNGRPERQLTCELRAIAWTSWPRDGGRVDSGQGRRSSQALQLARDVLDRREVPRIQLPQPLTEAAYVTRTQLENQGDGRGAETVRRGRVDAARGKEATGIEPGGERNDQQGWQRAEAARILPNDRGPSPALFATGTVWQVDPVQVSVLQD
jgi:hypothetical protein